MIFARIRRRFLALFRKDQLERELNDELRFHLERDIEAFLYSSHFAGARSRNSI